MRIKGSETGSHGISVALLPLKREKTKKFRPYLPLKILGEFLKSADLGSEVVNFGICMEKREIFEKTKNFRPYLPLKFGVRNSPPPDPLVGKNSEKRKSSDPTFPLNFIKIWTTAAASS